MSIFTNIFKPKPTHKQSSPKVSTTFPKPDFIPYEERIKTAAKTNRGLYPPQVIGIHFCRLHLAKSGGFPKWYKDSYGIKNPTQFYNELANLGMIEKDKEDGKWKATELGEKEFEENRHLYWAHNNNFDTWQVAKTCQDLQNKKWQDKVRFFLKEELNKMPATARKEAEIIRILGDECYEQEYQFRLFNGQRVIMYHLMKFEKREGNPALANKYEQEVARLDKKLEQLLGKV